MAMLDAGIKTQASLAERIAEYENLTTAPKDTINRVFRGEFVAPTTITRIARVLQVEPASLHLNLPPATPENPLQHLEQEEPLLGKYSLVINCISPISVELARMIHQQSRDFILSTVIKPPAVPEYFMAVDIARHYKADAVLTIRSQSIGRFQAIQIFLYFKDIEQLIWTESIATTTLQQNPATLAKKFLPDLKSVLGLNSEQHSRLPVTPINVQEKYLKARRLLDDAQNENNLQRAQNLLRDALKLSPEYSLAHAALADSFIRECWRAETRELLEQAQQSCDRALAITPDDSYCLATQAHLYRITGRIPQAIDLCHRILQQDAHDIEAVDGLANAYLEAYNQQLTEIADAKIKSRQYAQKLTELEPKHWKRYLDLGNCLFITGLPVEALSAYETSALLNPNEIAFINLGVMYLCQNHLQKAYEFFTKAHKLMPGSYLGYEYLGLYHFFMQDYSQSIDYRRKAISTFTDSDNVAIHQIWGDLADAYRLAGETEEAQKAYRKAINIIDRDKLQGYSEQAFSIHLFYYYSQLSQINPEQYPESELRTILSAPAELLEQELSPGEYAKLARLLYRQDALDHAESALKKAINLCPGFFHHPEVKPVAKALGMLPPDLQVARSA